MFVSPPSIMAYYVTLYAIPAGYSLYMSTFGYRQLGKNIIVHALFMSRLSFLFILVYPPWWPTTQWDLEAIAYSIFMILLHDLIFHQAVFFLILSHMNRTPHFTCKVPLINKKIMLITSLGCHLACQIALLNTTTVGSLLSQFLCKLAMKVTWTSHIPVHSPLSLVVHVYCRMLPFALYLTLMTKNPEYDHSLSKYSLGDILQSDHSSHWKA